MSTLADIPVSHVRDALQGGGIDHEIVLVECAEDYRHVGLLAGDRERTSGAGPVLQGGGSRVMTGGVQGSVTGVLARIYEA